MLVMADIKVRVFLWYTKPDRENIKDKLIKKGCEVIGDKSIYSKLNLAFLHKGEDKINWEDMARKLWKKIPDLAVIAFSGASPGECTTEEFDNHLALSLDTRLLLDKLSEILEYCKKCLNRKEPIDVGSLYEHLLCIPWRYEYFLELFLRLGLGVCESNEMELINNLIKEFEKKYQLRPEVVQQIEITFNQFISEKKALDDSQKISFNYRQLEDLIKEEILQYFNKLSERLFLSGF
jgi:hypothetical protein